MSLHNAGPRHLGRAGWIAVGVLIASLAFIILGVGVDVIRAIGNEAQADAQVPPLIIEGR